MVTFAGFEKHPVALSVAITVNTPSVKPLPTAPVYTLAALGTGPSYQLKVTPATVGAVYKRAKKSAGISKQGGVHSLRHAFATHSLEAGEDLYTIKQLLGHSCIESTARYLRLTNNKMRSIKSPIEALDI